MSGYARIDWHARVGPSALIYLPGRWCPTALDSRVTDVSKPKLFQDTALDWTTQFHGLSGQQTLHFRASSLGVP
jgi:hypothetical protein